MTSGNARLHNEFDLVWEALYFCYKYYIYKNSVKALSSNVLAILI